MFVDQEGKTGHLWWLWAFLSEDAIGFRLDPTRAHDVPEKHFAVVSEGTGPMLLMVDRYSAYKAMQQVKLGLILWAFCWSHVRRDFIEAYVKDKSCRLWAIAWLRRIRELYRLQRERLEQHRGGEKVLLDATTQEVRECLQEMQDSATDSLRCTGLMAVCRPVLNSLLTHWDGLTRFVDDVRVPLDNNASERAQRGPALGRKNDWGASSLWGGHLAAAMFSLIATLHRHGLNPRAWLSWSLSACPNGEAPADIANDLPWNLTEARRWSLSSPSPTSPSSLLPSPDSS